jgi:type I restriction enzyme S subunit
MAIFKSWFVDFEPFRDGEFVYNEDLGKEIPKGWEVKKNRRSS